MANLFRAMGQALGQTDKKLIKEGVLARGNIVSCVPTRMGFGNTNSTLGAKQVCHFVIEVIPPDGSDSFQAECNFAIPQIYIPQYSQEGAAIAVRYDPADPQSITVDPEADVPDAPIVAVSDDGTRQVVTTHAAPVTGPELLRTGAPCHVAVLALIPLNQNDSQGNPATGIVLSVLDAGGRAPYQAQIGVGIPPAAADKVVVGATLPGKYLVGGGDDQVTIDWPALGA